MDKREHGLNWLKSGSKELKRSAEEVVNTGGIEHRGFHLRSAVRAAEQEVMDRIGKPLVGP